MNPQLKNILRFLLITPVRQFKIFLNKKGSTRKCYVCQNTFNHFTKFRSGSKKTSEFIKLVQPVGSDIDNFWCVYCHSHDRERHLFMFLDKLELWSKMKNSKVLHFAPEENLSIKISEQNPTEYIKADLYSTDEGIKKMDVTKIQYSNDTFDLVICNHVLEHVPNYLQALQEIYRVLKPNGTGILQTPYSKLLNRNFEEEIINTDALRNYYYGKEDHCRMFSEKQFLNDLKKTGFVLQIIKNETFFDDQQSWYYGINKKEDLIRVIKPAVNIE